MPDLEIPDDGFATIKLGRQEQVVDLYLTYNHLQTLRSRYGDAMTHAEMIDFLEAVKQFAATIGFTEVSHAAALRFHNAITAAGSNPRGNPHAGPTPGSPGSTEPESSDSPEE